MDNRIKICEQIAEDAKNDATNFDGKPFTGKTVGEYMGYHAAAIAALANLVKSLIEENPLSSTPPVEEKACEHKNTRRIFETHECVDCGELINP